MSNESAKIILPSDAQWGPGFDVAKATDAYVATIPAAERAKSDAYFEGGYWIDLWGALITVLLAAVLLRFGVTTRLRSWVESKIKRPFLSTWLFAAIFLVIWGLLFLPWSLYTGYFREHAYDMSNYTLASFLGDAGKGLALNMVLFGFAITGVYAIIRRVGQRWVAWATASTAAFMVLTIMISPVFLAPLFNDFKPLEQGALRDQILELAHADNIPADNVYWFDASRQTKRISANVSGMFGTMRISLNDNLLNGTSEPEILAVMAHEMGHYSLNHGIKITLAYTLVIGFAFWVVNRSFSAILRRHGQHWGIRGLEDPAGLPLVFAIFAVVFLLLTPVTNSIIRTAENQADAYGLDAARQPHGFASAAMRISNYRKLEPSALEEMVFFDHPSGRTRVQRSMQWLADHPPETP